MRDRRRSARANAGADDKGFLLIEAMVAAMIVIIALTGLALVMARGLSGDSFARAREEASQLANATLEQARALPFTTIAAGLSTSDSTFNNDPNISVGSTSCFEGQIVITGSTGTGACGNPGGNPGAWKQLPMLTSGCSTGGVTPSSTAPLSPHQSCVLIDHSYFQVATYPTVIPNNSLSPGSEIEITVAVQWAASGSYLGADTHVVDTTIVSSCGVGSC